MYYRRFIIDCFIENLEFKNYTIGKTIINSDDHCFVIGLEDFIISQKTIDGIDLIKDEKTVCFLDVLSSFWIFYNVSRKDFFRADIWNFDNFNKIFIINNNEHYIKDWDSLKKFAIRNFRES